jgi:NADPH:quinone reductase-like Zn-dependent oxidoreductase
LVSGAHIFVEVPSADRAPREHQSSFTHWLIIAFAQANMLSPYSPPQTMQAWIAQKYGGPEVLKLQERPVPVPADHEVLIKIHAVSVSSGDVRVRAFNMPMGFRLLGRLVLGMTRPRQPILGTDLAGTVQAVGKSVTSFKPGDAVVAFPGAGMRCHAQYRVVAINKPIVLKPAMLSFEEATSLLFGGTTALHFLRKARVSAGEQVLILGASGAVGSACVQLARHLGANVTGVCSGTNLALVRSLGATVAIDYTQHDFTLAPKTYDVIIDTVAASSFAACRTKLKEHGRYVSVAGSLADNLPRRYGTKKSMGGPAPERTADVIELMSLATSGVLKPVIDRVYPFAQMAEAHAYVDTGRKRGSVVVTVTPG